MPFHEFIMACRYPRLASAEVRLFRTADLARSKSRNRSKDFFRLSMGAFTRMLDRHRWRPSLTATRGCDSLSQFTVSRQPSRILVVPFPPAPPRFDTEAG